MYAESDKNAVFALLQPSIAHTGVHSGPAALSGWQKASTPRDVFPIALTHITHVKPSEFQEYLSHIESVYSTFQCAEPKSEDVRGWKSYQDFSTKRDTGSSQSLASKNRPDLKRSVSSRLNRDSEPLILPEMSKAHQKTSALEHDRLTPTPLSTIPPVYFDQNFRLENPRIFDLIARTEFKIQQSSLMKDDLSMEYTIGCTPQYAGGVFPVNAVLYEKLSQYVNTVEIHLALSISKASESFSTALDSLRELYIGMTSLVAKTQKLRTNLVLSVKDMTVHDRGLSSLKRRRKNLQAMSRSLEQLQNIISGLNHCKSLAASEQLDLAIQHILYVEQLVSGRLDPKTGDRLHWLLPNSCVELLDLRQMRALRGPLQDIQQLRLQIGKKLETRLSDVLLCDIRDYMSSETSKASVTPYTPSVPTEKLREELTPILQGVRLSRNSAAASTAFRQAVIREIKLIIRRQLPNHTGEDDDDSRSVASASIHKRSPQTSGRERSSTLTRDLRALEPQDAEVLLVNIYCEIGQAIRRLSIQIKLLLDITSDTGKLLDDVLRDMPVYHESQINLARGSPKHATEYHQLIGPTEVLDVSGLLIEMVEHAQSQMMKVLRVRDEQTISLELFDFVRYLRLNRSFVNECETMSGYSGSAYRTLVNSQIHDFISRLHEKQRRRLLQKMDAEKWDRVDFSSDDAAILIRIIESVDTNCPVWPSHTNTTTVNPKSPSGSDLQMDEAATVAARVTEQDGQDPAVAVINDETFMLVDSTTLAIRGIQQYIILMTEVPSMANDISKALLDYLKLYNSRMHQLVLGAGAIRTAGLANINARHLALASQSLSFFIALIPCLHESIRRRPSVAVSDLSEYDRLKHLLQEHQSSIYDTLVDIMRDRTAKCVRAMKDTKWDDEGKSKAIESSQVETLIKETLKLRRVLSKNLPASSARMILDKVFVNYRNHLSKAFEDSVIRTEAGQARLLRNAKLLQEKFDRIEGAEELGIHIVSIVEAKKIDMHKASI